MNIIQLLNSRDLIFLPHEGALYAINYISVASVYMKLDSNIMNVFILFYYKWYG